MNIVDWKMKMKEVLKIHTSELNRYYKNYHKIPMSIINNENGERIMRPAEEIHHSESSRTRIFKRTHHHQSIMSDIITNEGKYFTFNTRIKHYTREDVFLPQCIEKQSGILLVKEGSKHCGIIGGSPTFRYGSNTPQLFWEELLDKDEHFNQSLHEKLLSYETYLVMREIYPFIPIGTQLTVKELFNE